MVERIETKLDSIATYHRANTPKDSEESKLPYFEYFPIENLGREKVIKPIKMPIRNIFYIGSPNFLASQEVREHDGLSFKDFLTKKNKYREILYAVAERKGKKVILTANTPIFIPCGDLYLTENERKILNGREYFNFQRLGLVLRYTGPETFLIKLVNFFRR